MSGEKRRNTPLGKKSIRIIFFAGVVLLFLFPLIVRKDDAVFFNQFYIEGIDQEFNAASFSDRAKHYFSAYSYAWQQLRSSPQPKNFSVIDEMFSYVFQQIPSYAMVYPTEMYYYYLFPLGNRSISGNLRLVEIKNGKIGMGYFDTEDQTHFRHKLFSESDGVVIKQVHDFLYKVTYRKKSVHFELSSISDDVPEKLYVGDGEEFIAKIRDESGIIFILLFNNKTRSFYYVLDEEKPVTEKIVQLKDNVFIGNRTQFAYYHDLNHSRMLLFGVFSRHISHNDYFDGPFDQVPPYLNLREKLYRAYPYTQIGSGLDAHGNFLDQESLRVAISPYLDYASYEALLSFADFCEKQKDEAVIQCLTYDEKRDFHKESLLFYENGTMKSANRLLP